LEYIQEIKLDLNLRRALPVVRVKEGDASASFIRITLTKDDEAYTLESGVTVQFRDAKPDGTALIYDSATKHTELKRYVVIIESGGTVKIELTAQTTAVCGLSRCDLALIKNGAVLSTMPFVIDVRHSPSVENLAKSKDAFEALRNIDKILEEVHEEVTDAEAWAKGTRDGAAVTSSDAAYHNNAKYYAEQFSTYKTFWVNVDIDPNNPERLVVSKVQS